MKRNRANPRSWRMDYSTCHGKDRISRCIPASIAATAAFVSVLLPMCLSISSRSSGSMERSIPPGLGIRGYRNPRCASMEIRDEGISRGIVGGGMARREREQEQEGRVVDGQDDRGLTLVMMPRIMKLRGGGRGGGAGGNIKVLRVPERDGDGHDDAMQKEEEVEEEGTMVEIDEIDMSKSELKKLWDGCERPEEAIPVRADDDDCDEDRKIIGHVSKTVLLPGIEDGDSPEDGDTISVQVCIGHVLCLVPFQVRSIAGKPSVELQVSALLLAACNLQNVACRCRCICQKSNFRSYVCRSCRSDSSR
jgi:hypothetical protein